ncbi:hypothetical protein GUI12_04045 [Anaplasmataceae bacterium AB001_6]|nr:hypothetical protein GUI12_04045 [Anaplasmataceae bacterium AB001_6]
MFDVAEDIQDAEQDRNHIVTFQTNRTNLLGMINEERITTYNLQLILESTRKLQASKIFSTEYNSHMHVNVDLQPIQEFLYSDTQRKSHTLPKTELSDSAAAASAQDFNSFLNKTPNSILLATSSHNLHNIDQVTEMLL